MCTVGDVVWVRSEDLENYVRRHLDQDEQSSPGGLRYPSLKSIFDKYSTERCVHCMA